MEYELGELLPYEQPADYIVESTDYDDSYKTPVLTAGKSFIIGYTNETKGIYTRLPVIIFDDFTTSSQYVDFPFKVKSSAMKILSVNSEIADLKYLFYKMQTIQFDSANHKRYWISEYSKIKLDLPTLAEQQRIVNRIETMFSKLDQAQEKAQAVLDSFETRKAAILHKAFSGELTANWRKENGISDNSWEEKKLGDCGTIYGGGTPSMSHKEYWENGNILWITSKDMKSDVINDSEIHVNMKGVENSSAKYIDRPAVLFVMRSGNLRRTFPVCMVNKEFTVNQDLKALVPNTSILLEYLFYACKANERKILDTCMKSGTTVESINSESLFNFVMNIPSHPEQQEIVRILDTVLEKESRAKESASTVLDEIALLKKSILARAFRGEL